ncbi:hypothetical protein ACE0DR_13340 [Azotobacter sp. CWF10]
MVAFAAMRLSMRASSAEVAAGWNALQTSAMRTALKALTMP